MSDRIERLLLAAQEDIDTLGSELEIAERERDRYREALERISVCCDNGSRAGDKLTFIRRVTRKALKP